jgi:hypothetical protein
MRTEGDEAVGGRRVESKKRSYMECVKNSWGIES